MDVKTMKILLNPPVQPFNVITAWISARNWESVMQLPGVTLSLQPLEGYGFLST